MGDIRRVARRAFVAELVGDPRLAVETPELAERTPQRCNL
jgi:hypothetical protein